MKGNIYPPARNMAFRKVAWEKAGKFPEKANYGEDTVFALQLKRAGFKTKIAYDALAFWHVRENLGVLFKQHFLYAEGYALYGFINTRRVLSRFKSLLIPITCIKSGHKCYRKYKTVKSFIYGFIIDYTLKAAWAFGGLSGYLSGNEEKLDKSLLDLI